MNAGPDVERRISAWLAKEVPTRAPDRILPAAFERTRHTHQRRFGAAWRMITMNRTWQLATAAVVGILLIGAGAVWIGGSNGIGTPVATPSPTPPPLPFPSSGAVDSGTYRITIPGVPAVTVTLPAGWTNGGAGGPTKNDSTPLLVSLSPWVVGNIYADPCKWGDGALDPPVGPSVDDLANALAKQPLRNGTTPTPVTVDGYSGKYMELSTPADLDLATCSKAAGGSASTPGAFVTWVGTAGDDYNGLATPGSHDRVWILDVDGVRLVLDATDYASATSEDKAELQSIIDSIQIEPLSASPSASPAASP